MTAEPQPSTTQTRTQKERRDATRAALLAAGRDWFGRVGFHATTTTDLVATASVTRGALYHHFADKEALFAVLARQVAEEMAVDARQAVRARQTSTWDQLIHGLETYLGIIAANPEIQRIWLLDGPAVLGWERWRTIQTEVFLSGLVHGMRLMMNEGTILPQEPEPLANLILAALNDAALMIAHAPQPQATRATVTKALMSLVGGLAISS